jgi:recombination protein RecR
MQKRVTGPEIERLIQLLARVPGLGARARPGVPRCT